MSLNEISTPHEPVKESPIRVFLSYAHEDDEIVTVFRRAFKFLEREVDGMVAQTLREINRGYRTSAQSGVSDLSLSRRSRA
jgi:hypothetical protein